MKERSSVDESRAILRLSGSSMDEKIRIETGKIGISNFATGRGSHPHAGPFCHSLPVIFGPVKRIRRLGGHSFTL